MSNKRPHGSVSGQTMLAAALLVIGMSVVLTLDDPRLRFGPYLAGFGLACLGWLGLMRTKAPPPMMLIIGLGLVLRIWALASAPAFSEDVFRYVYEGRLVWQLGPAAPFIHPPEQGPALHLAPELLDEAWLRINHPEISTIYPPFSQLIFALAGGLSWVFGHPLTWLKLLLVAADLGVWALVTRALKKDGRPAHLSLVWGLCPLVILEVAREGHADSLSALGLALGIFAFTAARPQLGYVGWALAALAKLNGLVVLPAAVRSTRRGLVTGLAMCSLLATPWLLAGPSAGEGLAQYAQRWRAGDGVFSGVLHLSGWLLGGPWARFGDITLTQHQVARGLTVLLFAALTLATLYRPAAKAQIPARAGTLLLGLLLLAPTLHPWYVLWLLPFAAAAPNFKGRRAVLVLATLSALLHHPGWLELTEGQWRDLAWVRALVHIPVWAVWLWDLAPKAKSGYAPAATRP